LYLFENTSPRSETFSEISSAAKLMDGDANLLLDLQIIALLVPRNEQHSNALINGTIPLSTSHPITPAYLKAGVALLSVIFVRDTKRRCERGNVRALERWLTQLVRRFCCMEAGRRTHVAASQIPRFRTFRRVVVVEAFSKEDDVQEDLATAILDPCCIVDVVKFKY
jgi:hypothetical protein